MRAIEIIGGGLAGLSLGRALRWAGVPVMVHESGDYPRHRVCGEFITGLSDATMRQLDLAPVLGDALRHDEVAWSLGGKAARFQRLPAPALGISRHTLDARLAREFTSAGGELQTRSRITDPTNLPGRVFACGRRRARESRWIGLKLHAQNLTLVRDLEMHLGAHCYIGLTRVENNRVNVCGLFRRRPLGGRGPALLLSYLRAAGLAPLAQRLASADLDAESFCAVAALGFDRGVATDHRICLGDAGAMIPPFTGNGMAMAFQSAELALGPLVAFARQEIDWPAACRATHAALRARFRLRLSAADTLHPFLLRPRRQHWFALLGRTRLLPFGPLYAALH